MTTLHENTNYSEATSGVSPVNYSLQGQRQISPEEAKRYENTFFINVPNSRRFIVVEMFPSIAEGPMVSEALKETIAQAFVGFIHTEETGKRYPVEQDFCPGISADEVATHIMGMGVEKSDAEKMIKSLSIGAKIAPIAVNSPQFQLAGFIEMERKDPTFGTSVLLRLAPALAKR